MKPLNCGLWTRTEKCAYFGGRIRFELWKRSTSKEVRADPLAAQVQGGNVRLVAGALHADFVDEMDLFPNGKFRDQVDAAFGAFNRLALGELD